jgi:hypothetical protein
MAHKAKLPLCAISALDLIARSFNPSKLCFDESVGVLKFAAIAKQASGYRVVTGLRRNTQQYDCSLRIFPSVRQRFFPDCGVLYLYLYLGHQLSEIQGKIRVFLGL